MGALHIFSRDISKTIGAGFVTNMNELGMRMISHADLSPGDELSLHFRLPNNWKLDFLGTIVHKTTTPITHSYGIRFREGQGTFLLRLF